MQLSALYKTLLHRKLKYNRQQKVEKIIKKEYITMSLATVTLRYAEMILFSEFNLITSLDSLSVAKIT